MKHLNTYITEYIIKKKLDKPIDSEDHYEYFPKTKDDLIENLNELIAKDKYDISVSSLVSIQLRSYISLFISSSIFLTSSSVVLGKYS